RHQLIGRQGANTEHDLILSENLLHAGLAGEQKFARGACERYRVVTGDGEVDEQIDPRELGAVICGNRESAVDDTVTDAAHRLGNAEQVPRVHFELQLPVRQLGDTVGEILNTHRLRGSRGQSGADGELLRR